jgi:hypothetical protein
LHDPLAAGLMKNCYVRWKTFTLPNSMIMRQLGKLTSDDQQQLGTQMSAIFRSANAPSI